jgi:hypothetical protein
MRDIEYSILYLLFYLVFAFITSPIPSVCLLIANYIDAHEQLSILKWVLVTIFLIWFFGLPWLTNKATVYMAFENRTFQDSVMLAFRDLRFFLASLPLVGHWFVKDTDTRDDDGHDA